MLHLHHLAFRTHDLGRLRRFYEDALGLVVVRDSASVWLRAGDAVIMLEQASLGEPDVTPGALELVAFAIPEHEKPAWRARLAKNQIAVESETAFTLYFRDPDGRRVGLSHYPLELGP